MSERRGFRGWRLAAPVVFAVAGVLFLTSARASAGHDLRNDERASLPTVLSREQARADALSKQLSTLQTSVTSLTTSAAHTNGAIATAQQQISRLGVAAGLVPVEGPGLTVTLDDAPAPPPGQPLPDGVNLDSYVVHQQDVQAVVNALWAGGAEAMQLMDQRVIETSAVRCVGSTLLLQGRTYGPPFRIRAVGDPERLQAALAGSPAVQNYQDYVAYIGLGYDVEASDALRLPGYSGPLTLRYAHSDADAS
ncbi:MAG: DUF881 domain-containing protein [Actinomycetes bacterium]